MNKQELIEHISDTLGKRLKDTVYTLPIFSITESSKSNEVSLELKTENGGIILDAVPQKPTVPQFVADWYEKNKDDLDYNIWEYVCGWEDQEKDGFKNWFDHSNKAFQTIVNMHQFGYKIEEEKRYLVKIIGIKDYYSYLNYRKEENSWTVESKMEVDTIRTSHTRKELEQAGFSWVFDCPGVEVEEVE